MSTSCCRACLNPGALICIRCMRKVPQAHQRKLTRAWLAIRDNPLNPAARAEYDKVVNAAVRSIP